MATNETAVAMGKLSENAVSTAKQNGMALDYSRQSVLAIEGFMEQLHQFLHSPESKWTDKMKWSFALMYGGYIGEVVRRSAGGEWLAGTVHSDPKFLVGIVELSPATKVLKRLNNGIEDHLGHYVDSVLDAMIPAAAGKTGRVVVG